MLKINTKQELLSFKGEPLKIGESTLTVGEIMSTILGGQVSNQTLGWILGKKFATEESVDLKAEEVVFCKKEVTDNKTFMAIITGQLLEMLEGGELKAPLPAQAE